MRRFTELKIPRTYDKEELIEILKEANVILTWGNIKLTGNILS